LFPLKIDSLQELNEDYELSKEQIVHFRESGHVLLKQVAIEEEILSYRPHLRQAVESFGTERRPLPSRDSDYSKAFLQTMNLWENSRAMQKFVFSCRFAKIAADLLGVEKVRLYYDCALFKEPHGGHTPIHVDPFTVDASKVVTMWMPFVHLNEGLSSLAFISRSHRVEQLATKTPLKILNNAIRKALPETQYKNMKAGDATFHTGYTIHSAPSNTTNVTREVMTITYYADGALIIDPEGEPIRQKHLRFYFPGLKVGDVARTSLNPLLYPNIEERMEI
jgi:ectoine hydroxylase-related dioxygenase (phytanoyl-CoA dioxygenase family)